jgi:asparagine synthase (glutamine-hydrolysing)
MGFDPSEKMITKDRIEKYILRKAFDTTGEADNKPYLPEKILWRQKEQFSDGVGYGWIDALKDNAELHVTDEMMKNPKAEWGNDIPDTKEAYVFLPLWKLSDLLCDLILTVRVQLLVPLDV